MYQIHDIIFYGSAGVCEIDAIEKEPFEGAPEGVLYYVMHTLNEPRQTIFNPVTNDKVFSRHLMTKQEADAFLASAHELSLLSAPSSKLLREEYALAMKAYTPEAWVRVIKTFLTRQESAPRVADAERNFCETAKRHLFTELSVVFSETMKEAEARVFEAMCLSR
ncbi:MAG: hypothetical protein J6K61_00365 [Clostridia bacterium]|nr:hypothetical protein [Clostridia bacterium]